MDSSQPNEPAELHPQPASSPFGGAQLEYPVTFDLRIIYVLAEGATIVEDIERIYASLGVRCTLIQGIATPGSKYGRMGSRVTMQSREQMYATYEALGKLPYLKTAL